MSRITELETLIKTNAQKYYSGISEITDAEFDKLVDELRELDPDNKILTTPGWGFEPEGKKIKHLYNLKVGSLAKCHHVEEVKANFEVKEDVRISAKLDGLSCVSYYRNGKRFLSLTRGNGTEGLDITDKINLMNPETIDLGINFNGAVRGEVLCSNKSWEAIKDQFADNPSANQRNYASGVLNRKDTTKEIKNLSYVVYKVIACEDTTVNTEKILNKFTRVPAVYVNDYDREYFAKLYNEYTEMYPCDGLVITAIKKNFKDKAIIYKEMAFKFPAESKEVVVKEVKWNATRTGRIVPLITFDAIELSGAMVVKCTGYNAQFILENKITKGSRIKVMRSGEVIPKIVGRFDENGNYINLDRNYV